MTLRCAAFRSHPAVMAEMQKLLNRLIAKHTRSPADWRPASRTRVEQANPSRLRANAHRLGCGRPARAVSIRGRVLEAPCPCADPYHHRRWSCASPRAPGIGSRSRSPLSDCHAALTRSNTVYGVSRDGSRQTQRGHGIATSGSGMGAALNATQAMNAYTISDRGTRLSFANEDLCARRKRPPTPRSL